jgi:hypothetical protein
VAGPDPQLATVNLPSSTAAGKIISHMNPRSTVGILLASIALAGADSFAAAPTGTANPYNVNAVTNATVSPSNPSAIAAIRKRKKLAQLGSLRRLAQQNLIPINQAIDDLNGKIEDLQGKLDDDNLSDDEKSSLKKKLKSKEGELEQLQLLQATYLKKLGMLNSQIASIQH